MGPPAPRRWGWPCHNPLGATCCPASHPWVLHSQGAQHPWAMLSHSPPLLVAIEGPMLPSAGLAAQEQQELGSILLEVTPHECVLTLLPRPCPPPDAALGLLVASAHRQVFWGTGWVAHSHLSCAAPHPFPHRPCARVSLLPSLQGLKYWPLAQHALEEPTKLLLKELLPIKDEHFHC